jgi:DNA invertase Pin-like site-specific DNA recombinase
MNSRENGVKYVAYYCRTVNRAAVAEFVEYNNGALIEEFVEGSKKWPRLAAAIEKCKGADATLVIGKLGQLVKNVRVLTMLLDSRVDFACLDNQQCNRFTVHILAAVAEEEAVKVSQRMRRSMGVLKKKGVKLGSARPGHWDGREHLRGYKKAIAQSTKLRKERTAAAYGFIMPQLKDMRLAGKTMDEIATWLNDHGHQTTAGKPFTQTAVWRLLKRYLGDDFLGPVKDRGGRPQVIRAMEKVR